MQASLGAWILSLGAVLRLWRGIVISGACNVHVCRSLMQLGTGSLLSEARLETGEGMTGGVQSMTNGKRKHPPLSREIQGPSSSTAALR